MLKSTAHAAIYAVKKNLLKSRNDMDLVSPPRIRIDLDPRSRLASPNVKVQNVSIVKDPKGWFRFKQMDSTGLPDVQKWQLVLFYYGFIVKYNFYVIFLYKFVLKLYLSTDFWA